VASGAARRLLACRTRHSSGALAADAAGHVQAARTVSPAVSQILAAHTLLATIDTAYPPDDARRLLGHEPTSVEAFLSQRHAVG
jgi:hypothetical protein